MNAELEREIGGAFAKATTERERNWLFLQFTKRGGESAQIAARMVKPPRTPADSPVNKMSGVGMQK